MTGAVPGSVRSWLRLEGFLTLLVAAGLYAQVIYDEAITRKLEEDFMADLAHCVEFSATEYEARRWGTRFVDSTCVFARRYCEGGDRAASVAPHRQ